MNKSTLFPISSISRYGLFVRLIGISIFLFSSLLPVQVVAQSACISGAQTICSGTQVDLTVSMTGTPAFSFVYTDGTNNFTVTGITSNNYVISVTPSVSTNYSMVSMTDANGTGTVCPLGTPGHEAAITVLITPTAILTSNQTVCQGNAATSLLVNFTSGSSPWKIVYTDGTTSVTDIGITSNPYAINITPTVSTTYTLQFVSDSLSGCTSTGNSVTVFVQSPPTAVLSSDQTICQDASLPNQTANLTINLTGADPWNVTYSDGTNNMVISGISSSPFLFSVSPNHTTTYTVINVVDIFGCTATTNSSITVTVNYFPVPSLTSSNTLVCNSSVGTTLSFNLVGNPNFILTYTDGTTSTTVTGISTSPYVLHVSPSATTTYWVTSLIDANNCPTNPNNNVSLPIIVGSTPTVSLSAASSIICQNISGTNTIQLDFAITSGTQPWTLSYTDGTIPIVIPGITASPYVVTVSPTFRTTYHSVSVTDALGCTGTGNNWVLDPKPIPSAAFTNNQTICPGANTALSINLTGTGPWSVDYSDGTNVFTVTPNASPYLLRTTISSNTTYTIVSVSDAFCSNTSTSTATVFLLTPPTGTLSANQTICSGATANLTFTLSGSAPWSLDYSDGTTATLVTGITSTSYVIQASPTSNQTYTLLSVTDGNGCSISPNQTIVATISPVNASISASQSICLGNSTFLTIDLDGQANWDLTYSDGTNSILITGISSDPYLISISPTQTTTYTLNQIVDGLGCSLSLNSHSVVVVNPLPTMVLSSTLSSICQGQPVIVDLTLTGSQPWDIIYSDGTIQYQITGITSSPYSFSITPTVSTTYSAVQVSDNYLCTTNGIGSAPIIVHTPPILSLTSNQPVCVGGVLTISANGFNPGSTFNWSGPIGFNSTLAVAQIVNVISGNAGDYSLTVTDLNCGVQPVISTNVVIYPSTTGSTAGSNSPLCETQTLNLTSTNVSGAAYSWSGPNGFTSSSVNPVLPSVSVAASGQYTLVISSATCATSQTILVSVTVNPRPVLTPGSNSPICQGNNLALTMHTVANATSYVWTGPPSYTASASPPSNTNRSNATPLMDGMYTMTVTTTNCGVIMDSIRVIVGVNPGTLNILSNSPVCVTGNISLSANNPSFPGYFNQIQVSWLGPNGYSGVGLVGSINNVTSLNAGIYTANITSVVGCASVTRTSVVVVNDPASFVCGATKDTLCTGNVLYLTSQGPAGTTVVWSGPASFSSTSLNPSRSNVQLSFQGIYTCVATIPGCGTIMCTKAITINTSTNNTSAGSNSPVCIGNDINLTSNNTVLQGVEFLWSGPNGFSSNLQNPNITNAQTVHAGVYSVRIMSPGCFTTNRTATVVMNDPGSLIATWTSPVCSGQPLYLQGSGNNANSFSWSGPSSFSSTLQNPSRSNMQTSFQGIYTLSAVIPGCGTISTTTTSVSITCREGIFIEEEVVEEDVVELLDDPTVELWPNPIEKESFYIQLPNKLPIVAAQLINNLGQKIELLPSNFHSVTKNLWEVQLPFNLLAGRYILIIQTSQTTHHKSILLLR